MDHLIARFQNVGYDVPRLRQALKAARIKPTLRYDEDSNLTRIQFSVKLGQYRQLWMARLYVTENCLTVSGGVTKTFFGHNLWVFNNEGPQLRAILGIVLARLSEFDGLTVPQTLDSVSVERVELTNHHTLPDGIDQREAIRRIKSLFMVLAPNRVAGQEATLTDPGSAVIGKTKSGRECRVYSPHSKFPGKPLAVSAAAWDELTAACEKHLRVEMIVSKREIHSLGMDKIDAWEDTEKLAAFLNKKYQRYGLSVDYQARSNVLTPGEVQKAHPSFVEPARYWFSGGVRGQPLNKRNGSASRFRQFMLDHGFNVSVPFEHHEHLAHGLHGVLTPAMRAEIPDDLRGNADLFCKWWKQHAP